jgi:hypothetical protein
MRTSATVATALAQNTKTAVGRATAATVESSKTSDENEKNGEDEENGECRVKVYVASSWRTDRQLEVVAALRGDGHDAYNFREPIRAFSWRQCGTLRQLRDPSAFRSEVLTHPAAKEGFHADMTALRTAEATVLVLPCGRSAHLELGYAVGGGQKTIVLLDSPVSEPELMYLMCTRLCVSIDEVLKELVR